MSTAAILLRTLAALALLGWAGTGLAGGAVAGSAESAAVAPADVEEPDGPDVDEEDIEDLVADAQRLLSASGYDPGPIDGYIGPRTQRAIRAYQAAARRHGTLAAIKGPPPDDLTPPPELAGAAPAMPGLGR
jgi:peptidoglycan hydrolase-like protein with peptidoglycan-binding domain